MMKLLSRLSPALQQSALYAFALAGAKGISLLMVPIFTHYLSPADYGRLDVLQTLGDVLSIVIGLGLADTLFRFCGEDKDHDGAKIAATLYGMSWIIALCALIITQAAAPYITKYLPGDITLVQTRLILASLALSGTILVPLAWLRLREKAKLYLMGSLGRTIFQAGLAACFLIIGYGITGFVAAGFIACVSLSFFVGYLQIKDTGVRFSFNSFKTYGPYGGPLIFAGCAGFIIGSFDRWILAETIGTAKMAQYALAAKFGLITAVLIQPFDMWWHAKRFHVLASPDGRKHCARYASIAMIIVSGAVITVCSLSPLLITLLTPSTYHASITYIPYLVLFAGLHNLTQTLGFGIYTQKTTKWPAYIDGSAAFIALIAYFSLIPSYGIQGAIIATFIALFIRFFATFIIAQKIRFIPYPYMKMMAVALYTVLSSFLISSLTGPYLQVLVGVGCLLILSLIGLGLNFISFSKKTHEYA